MTGFSHFSMSVMQDWKSRMWRRRALAVRAESDAVWESWPDVDAAWGWGLVDVVEMWIGVGRGVGGISPGRLIPR